jgi:hypothetical protein
MLLGAHPILHISRIRVNQISTKITVTEEIKLFTNDCTNDSSIMIPVAARSKVWVHTHALDRATRLLALWVQIPPGAWMFCFL